MPGSFKQLLPLHGVDAIVESADAREDGGTGVGHLGRALRDSNVSADFEQRFMDAAQIAGTVVEERDHGVRL